MYADKGACGQLLFNCFHGHAGNHGSLRTLKMDFYVIFQPFDVDDVGSNYFNQAVLYIYKKVAGINGYFGLQL